MKIETQIKHYFLFRIYSMAIKKICSTYAFAYNIIKHLIITKIYNNQIKQRYITKISCLFEDYSY